MRKIQILGAFVAALAFSALAVASASATLWLISGKSLTVETSIDSHGLLLLEHTKIPALLGGGEVVLDCTGLGHGSVGPGALDLITEFLGLSSTEKNVIKCTVSRSTNALCKVGNAATAQADNLPWHTLLLLEGTLTVDHIETSPAGKEVGWEASCNGFSTLCSRASELIHFDENLTNGALLLFLGVEKAACSGGGEGFVKGMVEILGATVS
jgi:hypothetical protein